MFSRFDDPTSAILVAYWSAEESSINIEGGAVESVESVYGRDHPLLLESYGTDPIFHGEETVGVMSAFSSTNLESRDTGKLAVTIPNPITQTQTSWTMVALEQRVAIDGSAHSVSFGFRENPPGSTYRTGITTDGDLYSPAVMNGTTSSTIEISLDPIPIALRHGHVGGTSYLDVDTTREYIQKSSSSSGIYDRLTVMGKSEAGTNWQLLGKASIWAFYEGFLSDDDLDDIFDLMRYWRDNGEGPGGGPTTGTFGVVATDNDAAVTRWQWQESSNGTDWAPVGTILTNISGADTTELTVLSAPITVDGTLVRCIAEYPGGEAISNSAQLTVQAAD